MTQAIQYRLRLALLGREYPCLLLHSIQFLYQRQPMLGLARLLVLALCFHRLAELAAGVRDVIYVNEPIGAELSTWL